MKLYLDMCDIHFDDDNISIDITDDCIDWYNQNEIEIKMDTTVDNMELVQQIIFKTPFTLIINHKEEPDLSFTIDFDKLDIRITEWSIFIYIEK